MHTRNVNVKTAAQESSRKMGEEQNPVSVAREWVAQATSLKAGVTVTLSDASRYGDVQVELAKDIPYIWLYHRQNGVVARHGLVNVTNWTTPDGEKGLPLQGGSHPLFQIWLDDEAAAD